jgi:hypothetical protein
MSTAVPGGSGAISRTARCGQVDCANDGAADVSAASTAAAQ